MDLISAVIGKVVFFFSGGRGRPGWYYTHLYPLHFRFTVATPLSTLLPSGCVLLSPSTPSTPGGTLEGVALGAGGAALSHGTPVTGRIYFGCELGSSLGSGLAAGIEARPWSPSGEGYAGGERGIPACAWRSLAVEKGAQHYFIVGMLEALLLLVPLLPQLAAVKSTNKP